MQPSAQSQHITELESIDLMLSSAGGDQSETSRHEKASSECQDHCNASAVRSNAMTPDEETKRLWKRCNALLRSEKKLTKPFIISACIHLSVLVSVTISVSYCIYVSITTYVAIYVHTYGG